MKKVHFKLLFHGPLAEQVYQDPANLWCFNPIGVAEWHPYPIHLAPLLEGPGSKSWKLRSWIFRILARGILARGLAGGARARGHRPTGHGHDEFKLGAAEFVGDARNPGAPMAEGFYVQGGPYKLPVRVEITPCIQGFSTPIFQGIQDPPSHGWPHRAVGWWMASYHSYL